MLVLRYALINLAVFLQNPSFMVLCWLHRFVQSSVCQSCTSSFFRCGETVNWSLLTAVLGSYVRTKSHRASITRSHQPTHTTVLTYQWLETKRKRKLEAHEVFSEDPALYRWQCWASLIKNPNSKDPTFVEDPSFRAAGVRANAVRPSVWCECG